MGCASAAGKSRRATHDWQYSWRLGRDLESLWMLSAQFDALSEGLQNFIGRRKVATVLGNPVERRHAAIIHALIQIYITTYRELTPSLASRSSVTRLKWSGASGAVLTLKSISVWRSVECSPSLDTPKR